MKNSAARTFVKKSPDKRVLTEMQKRATRGCSACGKTNKR